MIKHIDFRLKQRESIFLSTLKFFIFLELQFLCFIGMVQMHRFLGVEMMETMVSNWLFFTPDISVQTINDNPEGGGDTTPTYQSSR